LKDLEAKKTIYLLIQKDLRKGGRHAPRPLEQHKQSKFKEHAARQRDKIKGLKAADISEEEQPSP
jgi:hypothetical protein